MNTSFQPNRRSLTSSNIRNNNRRHYEVEPTNLFQAEGVEPTNLFQATETFNSSDWDFGEGFCIELSLDSFNTGRSLGKRSKRGAEVKRRNYSNNMSKRSIASQTRNNSMLVESENNDLLAELKTPKAIKLYELAINSGSVEAMHELGCLYQKDYSIPNNIHLAINWYTKAANCGHYDSMCKLGFIYRDAPGFQDTRMLEYWYKIIIHKTGNVDAMSTLGVLYLTGPRWFTDVSKAMYWFEKAVYPDGSIHFTAKDYLNLCDDLCELTVLKDQTIREQFGMIIKILNTFIGANAAKQFIMGHSLRGCLSDKEFFLPIIRSKCAEVLEYKVSSGFGRQHHELVYLKADIREAFKDKGIILHRLGKIDVLLFYCGSYINFSGVTLACQDLEGLDLSEVDFRNAELVGNALYNVRLNIDQLQQNNLQRIKLINCTISYRSFYQKFYQEYYQAYKLLFAVDQDNSSFNIMPDDVKKIPFTIMLKSMIQQVEERDAKIERPVG